MPCDKKEAHCASFLSKFFPGMFVSALLFSVFVSNLRAFSKIRLDFTAPFVIIILAVEQRYHAVVSKWS